MGMEALTGILIDVSISPSESPDMSPAGILKYMDKVASSGISIDVSISPSEFLIWTNWHRVGFRLRDMHLLREVVEVIK
jgi:hypothetical protein